MRETEQRGNSWSRGKRKREKEEMEIRKKGKLQGSPNTSARLPIPYSDCLIIASTHNPWILLKINICLSGLYTTLHKQSTNVTKKEKGAQACKAKGAQACKATILSQTLKLTSLIPAEQKATSHKYALNDHITPTKIHICTK